MTPRTLDQPQEHLGGDRVLLRPRRAVAGRRPDEPAVAAHARAAPVGPRPGRPEPQARRLRGARRAHLALRPHLPDRDAGRHEHRPDLVACRSTPSVDEYGFLITPYRKVKNGKLTDDVEWLRADEEIEGVPRPGRHAGRRTARSSGRPRPRPLSAATSCIVPTEQGPVHRHLAQADGRRLGRPDPVPRARRRQPRADGLEHAAAGGAAAASPSRRSSAPAWRRDVAQQLRHGRRAPSKAGTVTYVDAERIDDRRATSTRCASSSASTSAPA